jgi:hypothetical protein
VGEPVRNVAKHLHSGSMKDCIGKLLLSAILPGHTGSWSDSWGGDSDWNEKMHPTSLSDWPLAIIRSPIFVDKTLSVVYKSVVIFLVSPDFRSDLLSTVRPKFGSETSSVSGPFFCAGKTLRTRGGMFRPGEFCGELLKDKRALISVLRTAGPDKGIWPRELTLPGPFVFVTV